MEGSDTNMPGPMTDFIIQIKPLHTTLDPDVAGRYEARVFANHFTHGVRAEGTSVISALRNLASEMSNVNTRQAGIPD